MSLLTKFSIKIPKNLKTNCGMIYLLVQAELASSRVLNFSTYTLTVSLTLYGVK